MVLRPVPKPLLRVGPPKNTWGGWWCLKGPDTLPGGTKDAPQRRGSCSTSHCLQWCSQGEMPSLEQRSSH